MGNSLDTGKLQAFVDVYRAGSFVAASERRAVDPSIVSRAVTSLEEELGTKLFQRTTRKLSPTDAGEQFFRHVEPLLEELERAVELLHDTRHKPSGLVRMTVPVAFGQLCVLPLLASFYESYPDIRIDMSLANGLVDLVEEKMDVAIRLGCLADSSHQAVRLRNLPSVACASPAYLRRRGQPEQPSDLASHDCLRMMGDTSHDRWRFRQRGATDETAIDVQGPLRFDSGLALTEAAALGLGVVLLPRAFVAGGIASGALTELFPDLDATAGEFGAGVWILYPSRKYLPARVRVWIDFLKVELARHG